MFLCFPPAAEKAQANLFAVSRSEKQMTHPDAKQILLIADDDPENIDALRQMLACDFEIKVATDGAEAVALAGSADSPALILLSTLSPAADAFRVCRELKAGESTRDIPVLLLAEASGREDTEAEGFEAGASDYITRPLKRSVVLARIRTHLELSRCRLNFESGLQKRFSRLHDEVRQRRDIENTYRNLVEHARVGIVIVHDLTVRFANPAFCKLVGLSKGELVGAHLKKFITEDEFSKNTSRYSDRIKGLNLPAIYRSQVIHSNGYAIDVELNVSVVPYGGSLAALVFVRDLREEQAWQYSL